MSINWKSAVWTVVNHVVKNITEMKKKVGMTWELPTVAAFPFTSTNTELVCIGLCTFSVKALKCTGLPELTCVVLATLLLGPAHCGPTCRNILHLLTPCIC